MSDIVSINSTSKEVGALIVHSSEAKGWVSDYARNAIESVPYLSPTLGFARDVAWGMWEYVPSARSVMPFKKEVEDVSFILKIPQFAVGNFSEYVEFGGKLTKTATGGVTGYAGLLLLKKAMISKDPICITLAVWSLAFDVAKVGSNILPYNYNMTRHESMNLLLKGAAYACIELKACEKAKQLITHVKGGGFKKAFSKFKGIGGGKKL